MKNCIIFSGQYRTFGKTKENIKQFIALNDLDVYCHLWSTNQEEIDDVCETIQPTFSLVEDPEYYKEYFKSIESSIRFSNPKPSKLDVLCDHASMNYSRKKAFELVNKEYDYFVYCRYDIDFLSSFKFEIDGDPNLLWVPFSESYGIISDIFCVSPFRFAKHYFLFDQFQKLHSSDFEENFIKFIKERKYKTKDINTQRKKRYCPHFLLLRNLYANDVSFSFCNFPVRLKKEGRSATLITNRGLLEFV
jgi:hypothetical protein